MTSISKIISNLPIAKPFPSLDFENNNFIPKTYSQETRNIARDTFVKPKTNKISLLKRIFSRLQHK